MGKGLGLALGIKIISIQRVLVGSALRAKSLIRRYWFILEIEFIWLLIKDPLHLIISNWYLILISNPLTPANKASLNK